MPNVSRVLLSSAFALLVALLIGAGGPAHAQTVSVEVVGQNGQPIEGVEVAAYTENTCTQPQTTGARGTVRIEVSGSVTHLFAYDPEGQLAPTAKALTYSSTSYQLRMQERLGSKEKEELINTVLEAAAGTQDVASLVREAVGTGASAASSVLTGIPGVFSLTPAIEDGEAVLKVDGTLVRQLPFLRQPGCPHEYQDVCVKGETI